MEPTTPRAPERRVLRGDDGAPLGGDRVLALALRWDDRPLSVEHVQVGALARPLDGVDVRWEGALPVFAIADGTRAWVEREQGRWVDAGRRVGLEQGEALVVQTGQLTLEARIQKRSGTFVATRKQENTFFGLVTAHTLMICAAFVTALVITPHADDESIWGQGGSLLRAVATPWNPLPARKDPVIEDRIKDALAVQAPTPTRVPTPRKLSALDAVRLLLGGGGGGVFKGGLNEGIGAAADALQGPNPGGGGDGMMGAGRDLGAGLGPGQGPGFGVGPLGVGPRDGLPTGLGGKSPVHVELCTRCELTQANYDRDLVLKVVRRHQNQIRFCYESELNRSPELAGKVTVAWTIDGTGSVSVAQVAESGLRNDAVENCILERVRSWKFPEPKNGQEVAITFPWVFQVAGSGD